MTAVITMPVYELTEDQVDALHDALGDDPAWHDVSQALLSPVSNYGAIYLNEEFVKNISANDGYPIFKHRLPDVSYQGDAWWAVPIRLRGCTFGTKGYWRAADIKQYEPLLGFIHHTSLRFVTHPSMM